jgi:benzoyl-CoA reductase/2-hydroxyglutaryl-CoA dehydratase subunit BcrC/BadD/HgdB
LDRALDEDLPELAGMVFMASCDAMRRLADAWAGVRPSDPTVLVDLPPTTGHSSITFLGREFSRLANTLEQWSGRPIAASTIRESVSLYNFAADLFTVVRNKHYRGTLNGGAAGLQSLYNHASTSRIDETIAELEGLAALPELTKQIPGDIPVYLFANVFPAPDSLSFFESCGVRIVGEDLCTGSRAFQPYKPGGGRDLWTELASATLDRRRCARTLEASQPGLIADEVTASAKACNARGVIAHSVKFCDPYFARLPVIQQALKHAGLPVLTIEGDCSTGSLGQQKTRIQAFAEMLR